MAGLNAQVGFAAETTYGTAVTVDRFYPFTDEGVGDEIEPLESEGIIAGARVIRSEQWDQGAHSVGGDVGMELWQQNTALLFEHMLGTITSSFTAGVGTHTVTPGDLTGKSLTVQKGVPASDGTVIPFTYAGAKIASWEVALSVGEIATLGATLLAQTETTGTALEAASFITDAARPYHYVHGAVSTSGSEICVREISIEGENNLADDRQCIGQDFIDEPLEMDLRQFTGSMTLEFTDTTQYQRYQNGDELSLVLSLSASATAQATITMNVRYDGQTPQVGGKDLVLQDIPYKAIAVDDDADAITIVLVNAQSEA